ncbi:unnamed protein product [Soboliphyme baturini]|uniref:Tudor domain-containing protein n=1 Tax=Soboliphyme baturini TaxID=241478 RepID=A0A183INQ9_9BILA|nr:unnamed protein product [Soboliphyme baturini]
MDSDRRMAKLRAGRENEALLKEFGLASKCMYLVAGTVIAGQDCGVRYFKDNQRVMGYILLEDRSDWSSGMQVEINPLYLVDLDDECDISHAVELVGKCYPMYVALYEMARVTSEDTVLVYSPEDVATSYLLYNLCQSFGLNCTVVADDDLQAMRLKSNNVNAGEVNSCSSSFR